MYVTNVFIHRDINFTNGTQEWDLIQNLVLD